MARATAHTDGETDGGMDEGACDVSQIAIDASQNNDALNQNNFEDELQPTFSQESTSEEISNADDASSKHIVKRLKELYHNHVLEAEKKYHLHFNFCLPTDGEIKDSEFDATPMVLLIGQYSTGKTTFLNHLLGEDFPGMHIGPEPTTDKFMALFHGGENNNKKSDDKKYTGFRKRNTKNDDGSAESVVTDDIRASGRLVKGNTLTVTPNLPFSSLSQFGSAFLNHFVGSSSSSPLLKRLTFIDTPGVLSGEKQRINRPYDFAKVAKWFADRSDLILLLFDAHKLDISDEFKNVIDTIRLHNDDKIRCVLNKADCVTREQLVRVYGSLMWSMGKIFHSPEVVRVYTGSYWNGALINNDFERMFGKDEKLLVRELIDLPRDAAERKVNQMVNRVRLVKVHVCILGTLSKMTPRLFGKKKSREQILNDLVLIMDNVRVEFDLSPGDMPDPEEFARCLKNFPDFSMFPSIDRALISRLDLLIEKDIPEIVGDADIVASEVRLGRSNVVEEQERIVETDAATTVQDQSHVDEKSKNVPNAIGLLGKFAVFCFLLLSILEGVYCWSFSRPAYSLSELHDGYRKILNVAVDHHTVSEVHSKLSPASASQRPTKGSNAPLSSLPTISGIAYTTNDPPSKSTPPSSGGEL
eukprot:CAMPEP_0172322696 /NCGR_PEP_ID=MMETSP1058-20130122/46632_1 /TAXON_ID=83371 /ORGANISM="Detonula confervacea, Strain CCMP 353" /LENGTH=641 /DNA_ID=CAMNT_0013038507 /DNA_START=80 /DNA_END=2005 /DNA_ORIENTATION=+